MEERDKGKEKLEIGNEVISVRLWQPLPLELRKQHLTEDSIDWHVGGLKGPSSESGQGTQPSPRQGQVWGPSILTFLTWKMGAVKSPSKSDCEKEDHAPSPTQSIPVSSHPRISAPPRPRLPQNQSRRIKSGSRSKHYWLECLSSRWKSNISFYFIPCNCNFLSCEGLYFQTSSKPTVENSWCPLE